MGTSRLDEVKKLKFQIKLLDDKIKELKSSIENKAIRYSDMPKIEGFRDSLLQIQVERLIELETKKDRLQMKIDIILEDFVGLPELPYKVLYYRHVEGLRWIDISRKLRYSVAQCHRFYLIAKQRLLSTEI